jgi:hypothetical protein
LPGFHITTQDDLPGPDGDEPYTLFVNQTEYGNARFLRTNVLSARPDLKKYTYLRFRQEVQRHADGLGPGQDLVMVLIEAIDLDPPLCWQRGPAINDVTRQGIQRSPESAGAGSGS